MNSNFSLYSIWAQGDAISNFVAVLLLFMSVATWTVIIIKLYGLYQQNRLRKKVQLFWHAQNIAEGIDLIGHKKNSSFSMLALSGLDALSHIEENHNQKRDSQLHDKLDMSSWLSQQMRLSIELSSRRLNNGLALLASIGSTAPFIGLFGTVWGIYHALIRIGRTGQTSIEQVAGPIGESLVMTALGLAVAIPAVLGYNALIRGNKSLISDLSRFGSDLHTLFITGARIKQNNQQ